MSIKIKVNKIIDLYQCVKPIYEKFELLYDYKIIYQQLQILDKKLDRTDINKLSCDLISKHLKYISKNINELKNDTIIKIEYDLCLNKKHLLIDFTKRQIAYNELLTNILYKIQLINSLL